MSKTGECLHCSERVTIPRSECVFQCRGCKGRSLFLCHVLPEPKDPMHIRCKECKCVYSLYTCPKCDAYAVIKDFQSGKMYNCLCGFQATMLACNQCSALLCLPNRKNYELTNIECKKCRNNFKYRLCPTCRQCTYLKHNQNAKDVPCFNESCPQSRKEYAKGNPPPPAQYFQQPIKNQFAQQKQNPYQGLITQKKPSDVCNLCLSLEKCMINTTCFHLSVCQPCSVGLKGRCPICRSEGEYKKVYQT